MIALSLSVVLGLAACVLMLPTLSDLLSLLRLAVRRPRRPTMTPGESPSLLFLVPAHNEEKLIASCLQSLTTLRYERSTVCVVADNCTDRTADVVRAAGVRCLERQDPMRPGKPHAIAWALERLPIQDFDAVVIVDADAVVDRGFASALTSAAPLRRKVVQAYNDVRNRADNALTRMAAILSAANHRFAFRLKQRAGLSVPLSTGMCLGTDVLGAHGWKAFSICEDWEVYAQLTLHGVRIESVPAARLFAQEAPTLRQSTSQRRRWMAGKLTVLTRYGWALARSRRIGFAQKLDSIAELSAVGPATQFGLVISAVALSHVVQPPGASLLAITFAASLLRTAAYTLAALRTDPEPARAALAFAFLPFYMLWRMAVAATALAMLGDKPWVRTERR